MILLYPPVADYWLKYRQNNVAVVGRAVGKTKRAATLLELLCAVAIIAVLASVILPATVRAYHHCRRSIQLSSTWHKSRYTAVLNDDKRQEYYLTNGGWQSNDLATVLGGAWTNRP